MRIHQRSIVAFVTVASLASAVHASGGGACNFSKSGSHYEENKDFVRVLNRFGGVLDLGPKELDRLTNGLTHVTDVPAQDFYYDNKIARRYEYGYICEKTGLSSISHKTGNQYPSDYSFCFIAEKGTLDQGEAFVERHLFLPREKWINYLDFPNRDGAYGIFLRTTSIGALIRRTGLSGSYYLKHADRYLSVNLRIKALQANTVVSVMLFDSTEYVEKQIACEKKANSPLLMPNPSFQGTLRDKAAQRP